MSATVQQRVQTPALFGRVAVALGGDSAEREVSLRSGQAVLDALRRRGVDASPFDPAHDPLSLLLEHRFDRVWIALHGRGGEDGSFQGLLQHLRVPYTGSGVLGSALAMDKLATKRVLGGARLPTAAYAVMDGNTPVASVLERLGLPLFVKPAAEGSSVGMSRVTSAQALGEAVTAALRHGSVALAEAFLPGPEYTVAILHREALPVIRIETPREFYDYEAKYSDDSTRYLCPCGLAPAREAELQALALASFDAVAASGWGRVDLMCDAAGEPQVLEVNTVPGMTDHSLVPMAAAAAGMDFDALVWRVLETSLQPGEVRDGT